MCQQPRWSIPWFLHWCQWFVRPNYEQRCRHQKTCEAGILAKHIQTGADLGMPIPIFLLFLGDSVSKWGMKCPALNWSYWSIRIVWFLKDYEWCRDVSHRCGFAVDSASAPCTVLIFSSIVFVCVIFILLNFIASFTITVEYCWESVYPMEDWIQWKIGACIQWKIAPKGKADLLATLFIPLQPSRADKPWVYMKYSELPRLKWMNTKRQEENLSAHLPDGPTRPLDKRMLLSKRLIQKMLGGKTSSMTTRQKEWKEGTPELSTSFYFQIYET